MSDELVVCFKCGHESVQGPRCTHCGKELEFLLPGDDPPIVPKQWGVIRVVISQGAGEPRRREIREKIASSWEALERRTPLVFYEPQAIVDDGSDNIELVGFGFMAGALERYLEELGVSEAVHVSFSASDSAKELLIKG